MQGLDQERAQQLGRRYRTEMSFATLFAVLAASFIYDYGSTAHGDINVFLAGIGALLLSAGMAVSARWSRRAAAATETASR